MQWHLKTNADKEIFLLFFSLFLISLYIYIYIYIRKFIYLIAKSAGAVEYTDCLSAKV